MTSAPWRWHLQLSAAAMAAQVLLPTVTGRYIAYDGLAVCSAAAIALAVRWHRPPRPLVWYALAAGQLAFAVADVSWSVLELGFGLDPYPSVADFFYMAGYPLLTVAVLGLIRGRAGGRDRGGVIDATIIATGIGLLSWTLLMKPIADDPDLSLIERMLSLVYPLADILLLAMIVRLLTAPGARTPAYWFLSAGLGSLLIADVVAGALTYVGAESTLAPDLLWLVSYGLMGAAALHPSMVSLSLVAPERAERLTRARLLILTATSLIAPAVLAYQGAAGVSIDVPAIVASCMILFLLVVTRMAGLMARIQDQAVQLTTLASVDGLTGIANRRAWDLELVRVLSSAAREGRAVHVALLDLDHFKQYNDHQGHQAGDRLLKAAAAIWQAQLRPSDLLARYGGEEFILALPGCTDRVAADLVGRLLATMPLGQTFSAGLASWDGTEDPEALVARADRTLYVAKRAGRNRIELADRVTVPVVPS